MRIPFLFAAPSSGQSAYRYRSLWLAIGWMLVLGIVVVSLIPIPEEIDLAHGSDKVGHFVAYGGLMLWWSMLVARSGARLALAAGFCAMGAVLEILQGMTGYRTAEVADALANSAGVAIGWALGLTRVSLSLRRVEQLLR